MNIPEKAAALFEGLSAEQGFDWWGLSEARHPDFVMLETDKIRRWLGMPTSGAPRPSAEFLAVLLGHGREGLLRIYAAFIQETARTDDEAKAALGALATLAAHARSMRLLSWDLGGVSVGAARGKPKILVAFDDALDARLRAAAGARGENLSDFIREAVRDRLFKLEKPLQRRAAGETAVGT
jgi:hypothetical protein